MKTAIFALIAAVGLAAQAIAADNVTQAEATTTHKSYITWDDPVWWEMMAKQPEPKVMIGRSDFAVRGPVAETFTRRRSTAERRPLMETLTGIPILGLFIPQPMPMPPRGGGKYFSWGERDLAWTSLSDHPIPGPQSALVSFSH